jgi:nucleotide-binding universal stress UspA family protein
VHVLVATDGSDRAVDAARRGLALLAGAERVTVAAVVEPTLLPWVTAPLGGEVVAPDVIAGAREQAEADARAAIERTAAAMSTTAEVVHRMDMGMAGERICELADELAADVIVLGSRGLGALRSTLLGSVSTHVVRNAPCPVLVIRSRAT